MVHIVHILYGGEKTLDPEKGYNMKEGKKNLVLIIRRLLQHNQRLF